MVDSNIMLDWVLATISLSLQAAILSLLILQNGQLASRPNGWRSHTSLPLPVHLMHRHFCIAVPPDLQM